MRTCLECKYCVYDGGRYSDMGDYEWPLLYCNCVEGAWKDFFGLETLNKERLLALLKSADQCTKFEEDLFLALTTEPASYRKFVNVPCRDYSKCFDIPSRDCCKYYDRHDMECNWDVDLPVPADANCYNLYVIRRE